MALNLRRIARSFLLLLLLLTLSGTAAATKPQSSGNKHGATKNVRKHSGLDRSGKVRKGKASYYGHEFYGKKMASGKAMNPRSNIAASKTLPLGTKAKVTNLETGKSAVVDVEDRGPYVSGRIIDLSPKTAEKLDLKKDGIAPVKVKPLVVPQPSGSTKTDTKSPAAGSP